jgi:hypothetical protein
MAQGYSTYRNVYITSKPLGGLVDSVFRLFLSARPRDLLSAAVLKTGIVKLAGEL